MLPFTSKCHPGLTGRNLLLLIAVGSVAMALPSFRGAILPGVIAADGARPSKSTGKPLGDSVEYLPRPSDAEVKIVKALEKPVTWDFADSPVSDVVDFLRQLAKVNIVVDTTALQEAGLSSETTVTTKLESVPLRSALPLLLDQLNLTYLIQNDVLKITTKTKAGDIWITRTYPVRDLCRQAEDFDDLVKVIEATVEPDRWSHSGGSGAIVVARPSGSLVIRQTYSVHGKVLELLRTLREARQEEPKRSGKPNATAAKEESPDAAFTPQRAKPGRAPAKPGVSQKERPKEQSR